MDRRGAAQHLSGRTSVEFRHVARSPAFAGQKTVPAAQRCGSANRLHRPGALTHRPPASMADTDSPGRADEADTADKENKAGREERADTAGSGEFATFGTPPVFSAIAASRCAAIQRPFNILDHTLYFFCSRERRITCHRKMPPVKVQSTLDARYARVSCSFAKNSRRWSRAAARSQVDTTTMAD